MNKFYKYVKNIKGDNMTVKDIMNKNIICVDKYEKVWEVAQKMKKYNIGFLPVIDSSKLIGVITDRDIVINSIANNNDKNKTIENYINKNIISINIEESIKNALNLMSQTKIKRLIVTNDKQVVGIVSLSDILTTNLDSEILKTIRSIWIQNDNHQEKDVQIDDFYL